MTEGLYELPSLPYLRLRFELRAQESAQLPAYQGSMLRGAFGHALRRVCCPMGPGQDCSTCILRRTCVYTELFEGRAEPGERLPLIGGLPASPKPFVFEPRSSAQQLRSGDRLEFDLLLFGKAVELQAFAVIACERMAADGLGVDRRSFVLEEVRSQKADGSWTSGYLRGHQRWQKEVEAVVPGELDVKSERLKLRFETPLRLQEKGRLLDRLDFRLLVSRMLRRVLELATVFGPRQEIDWEFGALLKQAEDIHIQQDLRWFDWQRYSNRQQRKMKLGGLVGDMRLSGDLVPFSQLLSYASVVHVGKGATFGLGKIGIFESSSNGREVRR